METFTYRENQLLPDLSFWIDEDGELLNLGSGYTFTVTVGTGRRTGATGFTKTIGITGAAGSGTQTNGTPNVTIAWEATDLGTLAADTYTGDLEMLRTADNKPDARRFELQILAAV